MPPEESANPEAERLLTSEWQRGMMSAARRAGPGRVVLGSVVGRGGRTTGRERALAEGLTTLLTAHSSGLQRAGGGLGHVDRLADGGQVRHRGQRGQCDFASVGALLPLR